ncbi:MAG TPA: hypothetical protein DDX98_00820 [Bacteroidales bacterium]|nr:hypothetical protein [Bacteroidales bacterium]
MLLSNPLKLFSGILKDSSKSRVILIRDKRVLSSNGNFDKAVIEEMLDKALLRLTGAANIAAAWRQVLKPNDVLGIKSNVWSHLATPSELEQTLKEKAMGIGIKSNDISINDRGIRTDKVFQRASALINVRPARTHHWSGVGTLIKNYIMFDAKPWKWHGDSCADLAKLWKEYGVDKKTRLNILVMMTPLFHGVGPHHYNQNYIWNYYGLLVGFDPVAVDATGVRILQAKRKEFFGEDRPINPPPKHIVYGETRHQLGVANPEKIELIKLGDEEDILI